MPSTMVSLELTPLTPLFHDNKYGLGKNVCFYSVIDVRATISFVLLIDLLFGHDSIVNNTMSHCLSSVTAGSLFQ